MRSYLFRSDLHIARSVARRQSFYGGDLAYEVPAIAPTNGHLTVVITRKKLRGQIPASMLERVIQERLCRAILGLNVRHDLDIEPAT